MDPDELHEMVTFLKLEFEAGRVKVSSPRTLQALAQVRMDPNGKIDPSTVDGSVQALARAVLHRRIHRALREVPLREVQREYFDILEATFGKLYSEAKRHELSPQQISDDASERPSLVSAFGADVDEFAAGLEEFWNLYAPVVEAHLSDLTSLKSVFGGDIFPSYTSNIACSVGLYMDTIVLPDPLSRLLTLRRAVSPKELFRLVVKHALNALGYRDLSLADVNPPIVVIAPDRFGLDRGYSATVKIAGDADALIHASRIFGRTFVPHRVAHTPPKPFPKHSFRECLPGPSTRRGTDPGAIDHVFLDWVKCIIPKNPRFTQTSCPNYGPTLGPF